MGLAFDSIYPEVYPVAYKHFESGMKRYRVAAAIFKQFGNRYGIPEDEINSGMIDLSISCAEEDFEKNSKSNNKKQGKGKVENKPKIIHINDFNRYWELLSQIMDKVDVVSDEIYNNLFDLACLRKWKTWSDNQPLGTKIHVDEDMLRNTGDENIDFLWEVLDTIDEVRGKMQKNSN
jgi:hypothetical protein